jgi:hypothetical protein
LLIERQVAPALILLGALLVLPGSLGVLQGHAERISTGAMVFGSFLGGLGLIMAALLLLDRDHALAWPSSASSPWPSPWGRRWLPGS